MKNDKQYIGITDNRLKHMRGVAEKCYELAKENSFSEESCRKMYTIGFMHDIGYSFSEKSEDHPDISADMLESVDMSEKEANAVRYHGKIPPDGVLYDNEEWEILVTADLSVDSEGNDVGIAKRLEDIRKRYGKDSHQYRNAEKMAEVLHLL